MTNAALPAPAAAQKPVSMKVACLGFVASTTAMTALMVVLGTFV